MFTSLISTKELTKHLDDSNLVIFDCRFSLADTEWGRKEYAKAHIPGAIYVHLDEDLSGEIISGKTSRHPLPEVESFSNKLSNWGVDENVQVIIYDQKHGGIAARLWWMLRWLGHEKVAVLNGGWPAWEKDNLQSSKETSLSSPKKFTPKLRPELLVDVGFIEDNLGKDDFVLIDSRAANRYLGKEEPIDPVAGHIPGAISAPFAENVNEDGIFLNQKKLLERFEKLLKDKSAGASIFYCGSGVTACHNLLAFYHAGLGDAKLYAGSWSGWITDPKRPVASEK